MEITWHGNYCYKIKGKSATIVINPDKDGGKMKGEIVLAGFPGLNADTVKVEGMEKLIDWPGEYEIKEVPILGFAAEGGNEPAMIFCLEVEKVKICYLGNLGEVLSSNLQNEIGDVDILIVNAGEGSNLSLKEGIEIVESIDPRMVIAMGPAKHDLFLKELGAENLEGEEKLVIKSKSDLPEDVRRYVVLNKG